jgi:hypothetical protein
MSNPSQNNQDKENRCLWPKLSKEAQKLLTAQQRSAAAALSKDLDDAWKTIDEVTEQIAGTHHKSIRSIRSALHMGHGELTRQKPNKTSPWNAYVWKTRQDEGKSGEVIFLCSPSRNNSRPDHGHKALPELVHRKHPAYLQTTDQERQALVNKFEAERPVRKVPRLTNKAKVQDAKHTISRIENEVWTSTCTVQRYTLMTCFQAQ